VHSVFLISSFLIFFSHNTKSDLPNQFCRAHTLPLDEGELRVIRTPSKTSGSPYRTQFGSLRHDPNPTTNRVASTRAPRPALSQEDPGSIWKLRPQPPDPHPTARAPPAPRPPAASRVFTPHHPFPRYNYPPPPPPLSPPHKPLLTRDIAPRRIKQLGFPRD
jgi:hypothetical protein